MQQLQTVSLIIITCTTGYTMVKSPADQEKEDIAESYK